MLVLNARRAAKAANLVRSAMDPRAIGALYPSRARSRRSGNRFADKIMRNLNKLARDRTQNRYPLLLIARRAGPDSRQESPR
jgi:hypothetical protein